MIHLTPEQERFRQGVREFVEREIFPFAHEWDKNQVFPHKVIREMGALGYLGALAPEEYGGLDLDYITYAILVEEVARGCAACAVILSVTNSFGCYILRKYGTDEIKERYLHDIATGKKIVCFAQSEPNAGSDPGSIITSARPEGKGYIINGTKVFLSTGANADLIVCVTTMNPALKHKGITTFLLEKGWKGIHVTKHEDKMGMRASDCVQMVFEDVYVPGDNIIGGEGMGFKISMDALDCGRIGIAAQATGIAQRALETSLEYASRRMQFGQSIGKHQGIAFKIADMATRVECARLLTHHAARMKQEGARVSRYASMAKMFASDTAMECAIETVQILGASGIISGSIAEQLFRDAKVTQIYEGTNEIQRIVISRSLLE